MKLTHSFLLALIVTLSVSCGSSRKKADRVSRDDPRFHTKTNYSDAFISAAEIDTFFNKFPGDPNLKKQVVEFYGKRDFQMAWFISGDVSSTAENFYDHLLEHIYVLEDTNIYYQKLYEYWGMKDLRKRKKPANVDSHLELLLSTSYFKYAEKAFGGTVQNPKTLEWYIPKKKKNYVTMLDALVSGEISDEELLVNNYYSKLKDHLIIYKQIEANGGWPRINSGLKDVAPGSTNDHVPDLRKFLFLTGDIKENNGKNIYDVELGNGVSSFQSRMGITESGKIDDHTLKQMNIPVETRIRQIMINMERMRWFSSPDSSMNFIVVNIPSFRLFVFEKGKLAWDMDVVVGTTANRTTVFKGSISQVVVNPHWNVPESIIENEMLDRLQSEPEKYIESQSMEVLSKGKVVDASSIDWSDEEEVKKVHIRQKPGDQNSLGKYKFLFPNSFSIYLHDTPAKHLFQKDVRSFSHGCIRVADPGKLADYLLRFDKTWTEEREQQILASGEETFLKVQPPLPVYLVYFTAWVHDNDLKLNFRDDIYEHDKRLARELFDEAKTVSLK